jgi:hypothetical protein
MLTDGSGGQRRSAPIINDKDDSDGGKPWDLPILRHTINSMNPIARREEGHSGVAMAVEKLGGALSRAVEKK